LIPLRQRGLFQGLLNVFFGLGTGIGGFVGGIFADNPSLGGWRGAFLIQVPMTLVSTLLIHTFLILPKGSLGLGVKGDDIWIKLKLIDWFGSVSLIITLVLFLTGASIGGEPGFEFNGVKFISLVIITVLSFATFIHIELKVAKNPTLPLRFLKIPTVTGVSISNFFSSMGTFATVFIVPIYFRVVFDLDSTQIGKRFSPNFFSIILGSLGAGYYMKITGKYRTLLILSGFVLIYGSYRVFKLSPSYTTFEQYIIFAVPGIGGSVMITITLLALIAAVPHEHQASTTSISYLFRSCGSTLGVSVGAEIFNKSLKYYLNQRVLKFVDEDHSIEELTKIIFKAIHSSEYIQNKSPLFIRQTLIDSYASAAKNSFAFAFAAAILSFLGTLLIKEYTLHNSLKR
jgi:MFS family permease